MALKVPDVGELLLLNILTGLESENFNTLTMRLFQNNITPADTDVLATYTEADFSGYGGGTPFTNWGAALLSAGKAQSQADSIDNTHDGGPTNNNIYGYYVTDSANSKLYWAERDPAAPTVLNANGQKFTVVPRFTLATEF